MESQCSVKLIGLFCCNGLEKSWKKIGKSDGKRVVQVCQKSGTDGWRSGLRSGWRSWDGCGQTLFPMFRGVGQEFAGKIRGGSVGKRSDMSWENGCD